MVRKVVLVILWVVIIFIINVLGRYLYIEFFIGYHYMHAIYIILMGFYATLIAIMIFFGVNYIVSKKRKEQNVFSFTKTRLLIMIVSIVITLMIELLYSYLDSNYKLWLSA